MIDYEKEISNQFEPQIGIKKKIKFTSVPEAVAEINKAYKAKDREALKEIIFDFATCLSRKG